jgi:hypothetical protein
MKSHVYYITSVPAEIDDVLFSFPCSVIAILLHEPLNDAFIRYQSRYKLFQARDLNRLPYAVSLYSYDT